MNSAFAGAGVILGGVALLFVYGLGVEHEKERCDARIRAAQAKFEQLQSSVKQVVEEFEQSVDIEKGDKDDAAVLKEIMVRLHAAATNIPSRCVIDPADVADAGRLRDLDDHGHHGDAQDDQLQTLGRALWIM